MEKPLNKKIALVTGGSRGIGAAIVRRLAQEGAHVAFTYSSSEKAAKALAKEVGAYGNKAKAYPADAAAPKSLPRLVAKVLSDFGGLDILVNNAGIFMGGKIGEIRAADYERLMRVNVDAVFALTNAAVKVMKAGARIINISSVLGERACGPDMGVYNASKFAVTGFSRSWAKDLGAKGILVNAVQPGPINTELNPETGENADVQKSRTALGRFGRPEEVAAAVVFLAGPDAAYITGATLNVDGGWNA
ncbi:3-oxoacyl-[acyl-carrier protein] reductase [Anaerolineae bacterium]|nr:3-oxoacyl-[acyl-carrier protein] reductase [Anaerolineae bacterium]